MDAMPGGAPRRGALGFGPLAPFRRLWRDRALIVRLAAREISGRYRGTMAGLFWLVLLPLFMLGVYVYAFGVIFQARWGGAEQDTASFALLLFSGLSLFNFIAETWTRAPGVVLENPAYVKKVIFPLEALVAASVLASGFTLLVNLCVLALAYPFVFGAPPLTALFLPVVLAPLALLVLGVSYFLASIGVFLRDVRPLIGVLMTAMLFLSPVFYPLEAVPEGVRAIIALNPMSVLLEEVRGLLFWGTSPNVLALSVQYGLGVAVFLLGWAWFARTRKAFADVL